MAQINDNEKEISQELMRNSQQIAKEIALRAKEIQSRTTNGNNGESIPTVPIRGDANQRAPQIPPKRLNLKQTTDENLNEQGKPIPLPQRNQPQRAPPIPEKPMKPQINEMTSQPQEKNVASIKNQNIVNIMNSPLFQQRALQMQKPTNNTFGEPNVKNQKKLSSTPPDSDYAEDALRGIERGLKNMERAMQEQLNFNRNVDNKNFDGPMQFNPMEFKRSLGGSINALDGPSQNMRTLDNLRLNFDPSQYNPNLRIERGISMDQMRLELMQNTAQNNKKMIEQSHQQVIQHNIYRSLDRNLPLELQYSRHRVQDADFIRQYNQNAMMARQQPAAVLSRDDIRIRRRSSHDETQYVQQQQIQQQSSQQQQQQQQQVQVQGQVQMQGQPNMNMNIPGN